MGRGGRRLFVTPLRMSKRFIFSSESVGEGHPDKVADTISDAVLDACLARDKFSRVACETLCKTGFVVIAGEITTKSNIDFGKLARALLRGLLPLRLARVHALRDVR